MQWSPFASLLRPTFSSNYEKKVNLPYRFSCALFEYCLKPETALSVSVVDDAETESRKENMRPQTKTHCHLLESFVFPCHSDQHIETLRTKGRFGGKITTQHQYTSQF